MTWRDEPRGRAAWRIGALGFSVGLLLLVLAAIASILSLQAQRRAGEWVSHSHAVSQLLGQVLADLQDTEAGQRGYIITGVEQYLETYRAAALRISPEIEQLTKLTADNSQQQRLRRLEALTKMRLALMQEGIERRRRAGFEAGAELVRSGQGKAMMDEIRAVIAEMDREEAALLVQRESKAEQRKRWLVVSTSSAGALGLLLVSMAAVSTLRSRRAVLGANAQLRENESRLRESELRYRTLFESIDEGFCIIKMIFDEKQVPIDYRFLQVNPSFEKQTGLANATGKRMRELAPLHEAHWFEIYGKIALTGEPARFQNQAAQLHRWYDVYAFRIGTPEDRHVAILFSDISERKRTQEALQEVNKELEDFSAVVSHDLRAPLRAVTTLATWLQRDYAAQLDAQGRENLAEMVTRIGRMDRMIEDILQYSRLGKVAEKPERVPLAELVAGVVHDLAPPPHVHIEVAASLPVVRGEAIRLRQLFQNLIGNAIKYGNKPQTEVRIDCSDAGIFWQISVADNGRGIEERHFERIFKIFQTLAPKDKTDSTGVGLALVKRIVERAGGRVWVQSQPGEGSTFFFTWPKGSAGLAFGEAAGTAAGRPASARAL